MWTPIEAILSGSPEDFGHKALRLAEARDRGLAIPDSAVLCAADLARLRQDPAAAEACARELLECLPGHSRLILRSSSPLEDRPGSSAAGLLPSLSRSTRMESLAEALRAMAAAGVDPTLRALLGTGEEPIPLAVLAQPLLELELWCTLEWDPRRGRARIEGRQLDACGDHAFRHEELPLDATDTLGESGVGLGALMELARGAQEGSEGVWLLELGMRADAPVLLQRRPMDTAAPSVGGEWREFPVFDEDRRGDWIWDRSHSPRPLAPLLASLFVDWIRERGPRHPSRIIDGRWHDRRGSATARGQKPVAPAPGSGRELRSALRAWHEERIPSLERGLEQLEELGEDCAGYGAWCRFARAWLDWQTAYYDGAAVRLRSLAAAALPPERDAWELPATAAGHRELDLDRLAAAWRNDDESERAEALGSFLDEHGFHGPGGWDGYTVPWDEDPSPLIREIERRTEAMGSARPESSSASEAEGPGSVPLPPEEAPDESWAGHALAALEDDDELLAYAYALFRDAALQLEEALQPGAGTGEILDILAPDLAALEVPATAEAWRAARARGARVLARWERSGPESAAPASVGEKLHGHPPLSAGRARGPIRILDSAQRDGGPEAGEILVVPTVLPADAMVFSRCAGLICESGEVLGHAAVLAREHHIPALVLPEACSRLRGASRVALDAALGEVEVLDEEEGA